MNHSHSRRLHVLRQHACGGLFANAPFVFGTQRALFVGLDLVQLAGKEVVDPEAFFRFLAPYFDDAALGGVVGYEEIAVTLHIVGEAVGEVGIHAPFAPGVEVANGFGAAAVAQGEHGFHVPQAQIPQLPHEVAIFVARVLHVGSKKSRCS